MVLLKPWLPENPYRVIGDIAEVDLLAADGTVKATVIIDAVDLPVVLPHRWYARPKKHITYAVRSTDDLRMHRLLLGPPEDKEIDHVDRDGLNNRRSNLRIVSRGENAQNLARRGREHLRNITFDKVRKKWVVQLTKDQRWIAGGRFDTLAEAQARAAELRAEHFPFANAALDHPLTSRISST